MAEILSEMEILAWVSRLVRRTGGNPRDINRLHGTKRDVPPSAVARMAGISYRMLKYLARGQRRLSLKLRVRLSGVILQIESGRVRFQQKRSCESQPLPVEAPRPRVTGHVTFGGHAPRLSFSTHAARPPMPSFKDVFRR